jgi:hypothetical protein
VAEGRRQFKRMVSGANGGSQRVLIAKRHSTESMDQAVGAKLELNIFEGSGFDALASNVF